MLQHRFSNFKKRIFSFLTISLHKIPSSEITIIGKGMELSWRHSPTTTLEVFRALSRPLKPEQYPLMNYYDLNKTFQDP